MNICTQMDYILFISTHARISTPHKNTCSCTLVSAIGIQSQASTVHDLEGVSKKPPKYAADQVMKSQSSLQ